MREQRVRKMDGRLVIYHKNTWGGTEARYELTRHQERLVYGSSNDLLPFTADE